MTGVQILTLMKTARTMLCCLVLMLAVIHTTLVDASKPILDEETEVLRSLGRPVKEARSTRQNPHDRTATDVFYTFQYEGLELRIGAFPGATPPTAGPMLVVLTSAKYKLKHQLQVGSSKKEVQRVLGWPETDFEMSTWSYRGDDAGYLWLQFTFHNDRVSRIIWSQTWD